MTASPHEPHLPLTEATFLILLSLVPGPSHGYAILKDVRSLSGDRVRLSTGTLYGALKRLLELGWIARAATHEAPGAGRPSHDYELTAAGRRLFEAETERLEALTKAARHRLARGEL